MSGILSSVKELPCKCSFKTGTTSISQHVWRKSQPRPLIRLHVPSLVIPSHLQFALHFDQPHLPTATSILTYATLSNDRQPNKLGSAGDSAAGDAKELISLKKKPKPPERRKIPSTKFPGGLSLSHGSRMQRISLPRMLDEYELVRDFVFVSSESKIMLTSIPYLELSVDDPIRSNEPLHNVLLRNKSVSSHSCSHIYSEKAQKSYCLSTWAPISVVCTSVHGPSVITLGSFLSSIISYDMSWEYRPDIPLW